MSLKKLLQEKNIKLVEVSNKLNISRQNLEYKIKAWDKKRRGFTIDELNCVANMLGETINFFI